MTDIYKRIDRRFAVIEKKDGTLYLFAFDGIAIAYAADCDPKELMHDLELLTQGCGMKELEKNTDNPAKTMSEACHPEWDWEIIADNNGIYYDRMKMAGAKAFELIANEK